MIQRFLNYSVNPRQYRVALAVNGLLPVGFGLHLSRSDGWGGDTVGSLGLGVLAYSFGEYAFHRWIAHGVLARYLDVHHDAPDRLFTTPWFMAPVFVLVTWPGLASLTSPAAASAFFLGAALLHGYADLQHYLQHHTASRHWLRAHHLHHHRRQTVNFGMTTRLWDYLLGTLERAR